MIAIEPNGGIITMRASDEHEAQTSVLHRLRQAWRRQSPATLAKLALLATVLVIVVAAMVGSPRSSSGPTVTGKHHVAGHEECTPGNECVWVQPTWQLDVLYRLKNANTINVDEATYHRYNIGDDFNR